MHKKIISILLALCLLGGVPALAAGSVTAAAADSGKRMTISEAGIQLIKHYEGFRATVYPDGTGYAIGYGTHVNPADYPNGITEAEADGLMRAILKEMENVLYEKLLGKYNVTLTQNQYDALMDLTYNLSVSWITPEYRLFNMIAGGLSRYKDEEIIDTFARYAKTGGAVLDALVWRRLADAKVFLYSDYKFGGTQNYEYELDSDGNPDFETKGGLTISKFSDVNIWEWSYRYISPLTFLGLLSGYEDGTFRPGNPVTAGEALKMILVSLGYGTQAPTGVHYASGYLTLAQGLGLLETEDVVDLDSPITRALCAKLAANAAELSPSTSTPFADTTDGLVSALSDAGILTGDYAGGALVFRGDSTLTRGELCAIVWRLRNYR